MNILGFLNERPGGSYYEGFASSTWYRCVVPIQTLDKLDGVRAEFADGKTLLRAYKTGHLDEYPGRGWDTILLQRGTIGDTPMGRLDWPKFVDALHAQDMAVVMDYDDDYSGADREIGSRLPDLGLFDLVTVSTGRLVDISRAHGAKRVRRVPNLVVPSMFQDLPRVIGIGKLVVGLSGGASHIGDYDAIVPALVEIAKRPGVAVGAFGYVPDVLRPIPNLLTLADSVEALSGVRPTASDFFVPFNQYGQAVWSQVDVALCPVDPRDRYSWSRSPIKALEAMTARRVLPDGRLGGCAVVASGGSPVYELLDGTNGLRVEHTADAYYSAITSLLDDAAYRQDMQVAGMRFAERFHVSHRQAIRLRNTYAQALGI